MKLLGFDLEISRPFPPDGEWRRKQLDVSCCGVCKVDGNDRAVYTFPATLGGARTYPRFMDHEELTIIIEHLIQAADDGFRILSFNGLGFDFPFLAEHCPVMAEQCAELACAHYDIGFQMFCEKGYMVSMATAAAGLGLPGKLDRMHGALAPPMWSGTKDDTMIRRIHEQFCVEPGSLESQEIVLEYVGQDAVTTVQIYEAILRQGSLRWTSRSGRSQHWRPARRETCWPFLTTAESLTLPTPDTSWMAAPRTREDYAGWLDEVRT